MDEDSELLAILTELGSYKYLNDQNEEIINHNIKKKKNNKKSVNNNNNRDIEIDKDDEDVMMMMMTKDDSENIKQVFECGPDCLDAARALYRLLLEDDEIERHVFHYLGSMDIARNKLVPILITYSSDTDLVISILKIYVKLTLQLPLHIESYDIPKQTLYTLNLKEAFINKQLIKSLLEILKEPMINLGLSNGKSQDYIIIELVLTLIKNMLQIEDPISSQSSIQSEYRCHMHSNLIELLEEEHILELFLVLALNIQTNKVYKQISIYSLLLLEIFTLLLKNDNPNEIWSTETTTNNKEEAEEEQQSTSTTTKQQKLKNNNDKTLINLLKKEKKLSTKLVSNTSRGRFIGTYSNFSEVEGKKIINKTLPNMATVNPIRPTGLYSFSASLLSSRTKVIGERKKTPSSSNAKNILKGWAEQFLDGCYNTLMTIIIAEFAKEDTQILDSDRINFLLLTRFFTGFLLALLRYHNNRSDLLKKKKQQDKEIDQLLSINKEFEPQEDADDEEIDDFTLDNIIGSLSSTLSVSNFQFIFSSCDCYQLSKKYLSLEIAVSTLREMIALLNYMACSPIEQYNKISFQMQSSIYYDRDAFLKLIINLIRNYQPSIFSKSMILDLIDLSFTTVNMVENFCNRNNSIVIKSKKQNRKSKSLNSIDDDNSNKQDSNNAGDGDKDYESDDDDKKDDEEMEDQEDSQFQRDSMDFNSFMSEFAHSDIIKNLALVLGGYHGNSLLVNHQIIQIYKRIIKDMDMEPMFYQLSLFYLFKNLLNDPLISTSKNGDTRDLIELINQVLTGYFKAVESNPQFLIEILITKHKTDCFYLRNQDQPEEDDDDDEQAKGGESSTTTTTTTTGVVDSEEELDENGIPILKISKKTGRLIKKKVDSDEGENFLDSDDDKENYILQNIVSKMEDSLKKKELIEKIKTINAKKMGPKFIEWLQHHLSNAIKIRNQEKNDPSFSLYTLSVDKENGGSGENYSGRQEVKSIFSLLKFRLPTSRLGSYSIPELKNYTANYLTEIYHTIKQALTEFTIEKEKLEKEKLDKLNLKKKTTKKSSSKLVREQQHNSDDDDGDSEEDKELEKDKEDEEKEEKEEKEKKKLKSKKDKYEPQSSSDEEEEEEEEEKVVKKGGRATSSSKKNKKIVEEEEEEEEEEQEEEEQEEEGEENDEERKKREKREKRKAKKEKKKQRKLLKKQEKEQQQEEEEEQEEEVENNEEQEEDEVENDEERKKREKKEKKQKKKAEKKLKKKEKKLLKKQQKEKELQQEKDNEDDEDEDQEDDEEIVESIFKGFGKEKEEENQENENDIDMKTDGDIALSDDDDDDDENKKVKSPKKGIVSEKVLKRKNIVLSDSDNDEDEDDTTTSTNQKKEKLSKKHKSK